MDTSQLLYQQGLAFHRQGLLGQAKRAYEQAVQINPLHAPALHTLGVLASQANEPETGLSLIARALAIEPNNPVFLTNASTALNSLKRYAQALDLCARALQAKPDYFSALRNQGVALIGLLRYEEAIACFDQAIQINPNLVEIYILRSSALCEIQSFTEALTTADRLLALKPDCFEAHISKAHSHSAAKQYKLAYDAYDKALAIQPDHALTWFQRGAALEYDRRYADAELSYAKAVQLDSQLPYALGSQLHAKMLCCDWDNLEDLHLDVKDQLTHQKNVILPFGYQAICEEEASLLTCAKLTAHDK